MIVITLKNILGRKVLDAVSPRIFATAAQSAVEESQTGAKPLAAGLMLASCISNMRLRIAFSVFISIRLTGYPIAF
jgi:hypothetical protein